MIVMSKKAVAPLLALIMLLSALFGVSVTAFGESETDNTVLLHLLQAAASMEETDYTPDSYAVLQALYDAYAPSADSLDDQEAIDSAAFRLLEALNGLTPYLSLAVSANIDGVSLPITVHGVSSYENQRTLTYGTTVAVTAPNVDGYIFAGWLETVSKRLLSEVNAYVFSLSVNTSLEALYIREDAATLLYTTEGGCILAFYDKTPEEWAALDSFTSLEPAVPYRYGYTNGRWDYNGLTADDLTAGAFAVAYPVYDETASDLPDITAPAADTIRLELHYRYDEEAAVGSFIMNSARPVGVVPESIGMLFYYKNAQQFDPTDFYVNINNKMLVSQYELLHEDIYITNMRKLTAKYNWAVRGYATYIENGELKTVYSNQVNIIQTEDVHDFRTGETVPPTCTAPGSTGGTACFICGQVVESATELPATGHDYTTVVTQPTCTEDGRITATCSRCGDTVVTRPSIDPSTGEATHPELLATGHQFTVKTVTKEATLTSIGECEAECTNCGITEMQTYYIATGSCGEDVTYQLDHRTHTLTLSGSGPMTDYSVNTDSPFYQLTGLEALVIESGVTSVGECAFYGCTGLRAVTFSKTVTTVGNRAFYGCTALTDAPLPESITSIGYYAFYGCGFTALKLPESLQTIGAYAYSKCNSLTAVTLPGTLQSVGNYAFSGCGALSTVTVQSGIRSLGSGVFSGCTALQSATLESGVRGVESLFFSGCTALTDVSLPTSLTTIGSQAFKDCSSLATVTLPSSLTAISANSFSGCTALETLTLPESLRSIGEYAFSNCTSLVTALPSQLQTLDRAAFIGCSALTEITVPATVTVLTDNVFTNCTALTAVQLPSTLTAIGNNTFNGCTALTTATLPDGLVTVGTRAFYGCAALTALYIPASVSAIGNQAFSGCSGLTTVTVSSDNAVYDSRNNCQALIETTANKLLVGCCSTVLPDGISRIESYAFTGTPIATLTLPDSLTAIGSYAFANCTALSSVQFGSGLASIEDYAFSGCRALSSVTLPESTINLGSFVFENCSSLTAVTLPSRLTTVSRGLFSGCSALNEIALPATVNTIERNAFAGCSALTGIQLPEGLSKIDTSVFADCTSLLSIELPSTVTTISSRAFNNCTSLTTIDLNNVRSIGTYAFAGCTGFTEITAPQTVTAIGNNAFSGCTGLTDIYIYNISCTVGANAATIPAQAVIHASPISNAKEYADANGRSFLAI